MGAAFGLRIENGRSCGGSAAGSSAAQARSETIKVRIAGHFLYYYFPSFHDALRPAVPKSALANYRRPPLETVFRWRRSADGAAPIERRLYRTEPQVRVLVESQRPAQNVAAVGEIVLLHGLEGSGKSGYMRGMAAAALREGYTVHRFHMRTCGGTERLCSTLYHAGLTSDLLAVLRQFQSDGRAPVFLVGFSLGGNVALKLAGELGDAARPLLRGVSAVSTPIDLEAAGRRRLRPLGGG